MEEEKKGKIKPKHIIYQMLIGQSSLVRRFNTYYLLSVAGHQVNHLARAILFLFCFFQFFNLLFFFNPSIVSFLTAKAGLLLSSVKGSLTLLLCHLQPRTEHPSINTALLIDALLREHKEPVTDCHKRLKAE